MSEATLAEFQHAAVSLITERLLDRNGSRRFLLADEVGLGKTIVARSVLESLLKRKRQLTVVYLCSNTEIAEQNRRKLDPEAPRPLRRITELAFNPEVGSELRLYSFTPGTSLSEGTGIAWERRMLLYLCRRILRVNIWSSKWREYFRCGAGEESWRHGTTRRTLKREFQRKFSGRLQERIAAEWHALTFEEQAILVALGDEIQTFSPEEREARRRRNRIVGCLRLAVQRVVLDELSPDLVILDEVQRFRDVIDGTAAPDSLSARLFKRKPAVLILSATPYRMLALDHEREGHYEEFLETVRFLADDTGEKEVEELRADLSAYRQRLNAADFLTGNDPELLRLKGCVERRLQKFISRTERNWYVQEAGRGIAECRPGGQGFTVPGREELRDFVRLRRFLLDKVKTSQHITEYWKSCPAPFTFMDSQYAPMAATKEAGHTLPAGLVGKSTQFRQLTRMSLRFRELNRSVFGEDGGRWRYLWVRPTYFYYRDDFFKDADPTKVLIFSGWRFVPKAISILASDEAEARILGEKRHSLDQEQAPLRLTEKGAFHVFDVCCPSPTLADLGDPTVGAQALTPRQLEHVVERKLRARSDLRGTTALGRIPVWELVARIDAINGKKASAALRGSQSYRSKDVTERFSEHVDTFVDWAGSSKLPALRGGKEAHLVKLAAWSPANTLLRALWAVYPEVRGAIPDGFIDFCFGPLRSYFNRPIVRAIIQSEFPKEGYAAAVLNYCSSAHFQAVADEYLYLLRSVVQCASASEAVEYLGRVFGLPTGTPGINVTRPLATGAERITTKQLTRRTHFALSFGDDARQADDSGEAQSQTQRKTAVRQAFNSPFWPFVLATTSVGQEGLDFHLYCRDIVHWNLPSNPVDLEQREGRINRRDGLAIRRAIARDWPLDRVKKVVPDASADTWSGVFAAIERQPGTQKYKHGLFPHWVYECREDDANSPQRHVGLRRHLYFYAASKDALKYEQLKERLALYRLVFGQPHQQDLLDSLHRKLAEASDWVHGHESLARYMISLSPMRDQHVRDISQAEARMLLEDADHLRQLLDDVELIQATRAEELEPVREELDQLKALVRGHVTGRQPDREKLTIAVRALAYLRNPCDVIFDRHIGLGLQDDCAEVMSAARAVS